jgi:hypothetical protein
MAQRWLFTDGIEFLAFYRWLRGRFLGGHYTHDGCLLAKLSAVSGEPSVVAL